MAYLYRHIRLDNNAPFYIGIGNSKNYRRAYSHDNRNKHWKSIVNNVPFEVEIVLDEIPYEKAQEKEVEFIKLYGRADLKTGTLVNLTEGGGGYAGWSKERVEQHIQRQKGKFVSDETRKRLSVSNSGKKQSKETIDKRMEAMKGKVISKETREKMASKLRNRPLPDWVKKKLSDAKKGKTISWFFVPINQYDINGNFIKRFESIKSAKEELGLKNICKSLSGERKHCGGFIWKYADKTT